MHNYGLLEYKLLTTDPGAYFTNIFHNPYEKGIENFFGSSDSYWNDLKGNMLVKILSIFDVFSFGHYYINVIFYSFITFFGPIAFFRVMSDVFPGKKITILIATFLVPSFLYWTGGIHKEGLLFLALSLIIFNLYFGNKNGYKLRNWIGILGGLLMLLIFRNFIMVLLLPPILAWFIAAKWPSRALPIFIGVYAFFGIIFFTARYIHPVLDFPQAVVNKQQAFLLLHGNSTVPITELQPTVGSFLVNTPQAVSLTVLRPYPSDVDHLLSLAASLEINLLLVFFIIFLIWRKREGNSRITLLLCFFTGMSILLAIGFSVNNLGAIVRYRSIVAPLLVVAMAAQTDWKRIQQIFININNKNNINNSSQST